MSTRTQSLLRIAATAAACVAVQTACAETIIDEWNTVKVPPPPALRPVTIDRSSTALLLLDFNQQTCNMERRPRCIASIPKVKALLAAARAAGVPVVYTLGGGGKPSDLPKELMPNANEPSFLAGLDKFSGSDLEKILKDKGIKTVIVVGTAAHGAVIYTASRAAMLGMKVIVPVDGISADLPYAEQYVIWQLVNAPVIGPAFTMTTLDQVTF